VKLLAVQHEHDLPLPLEQLLVGHLAIEVEFLPDRNLIGPHRHPRREPIPLRIPIHIENHLEHGFRRGSNVTMSTNGFHIGARVGAAGWG
jgi:hypothetical protein